MLKIKFRFDRAHRDTFSSTPPWSLRTLFVNLTEACNQACTYCHAEVDAPRPAMDPALLDKILDDARAMGKPAVVLTGGEPLLHPRLDDVLDGCRRRALPCKIASNGSLLDDRMVRRLIDAEVRSIQVSLDTCDASHYASWRRSTARAHAQVIAGIERCCRSGGLHTVVSAVATRQSRPDLGALLDFCDERGVATFTLYHLVPYGRAQRSDGDWLSEREFIALCDELLERFVARPRHAAVDLSVPWSAGSQLLARWRDRVDIQPVGCIAGKTSMTVLVDGQVVPCVCLEDLSFACGSVAEHPLAELWQAPPMRLFRGEVPIAGCAGCPEFGFCLGGCRALAFLHHAAADAPDPACAAGGCRRPALPPAGAQS
jgi:radical SAM protein with 4Fe4S-binding SPASM domain